MDTRGRPHTGGQAVRSPARAASTEERWTNLVITAMMAGSERDLIDN